MSIKKIEFYLSGGASNSDPSLSLGGIESSVELLSQAVVKLTSNLTGVSVLNAAGNVNGNGVLGYLLAPKRVWWQKPNGIPPAALDHTTLLNGDGEYVVTCREGDATIVVDVVEASLPLTAQQDTISVASIINNLFGDISEAQAQIGVTQYRCIYARNVSASAVTLEWWIAADMVAADGIEIGLSTFTGGSTEETVANENAAPSAPTFYKNFSPLAQQITLSAGQSIGVWIKLTTPPISEGDVPVDFGSIIFNEV